MKLQLATALWAALGLCTWPAAQAARPLQTDDAGALGKGECEIEAVAQRARADGASAREIGVQLGCGVGANTQLALGLASARAGGDREQGLTISGKTALRQAETGPALALSWQLVSAHLPGESWRHVGTGINLMATQVLDDANSLHLNLGHAHDGQAHLHSTRWGIGLEHGGLAVLPALAPMAELFGDDREAPWWNLGLRWTVLPDRFFLDVSHGRQVRSGRPSLTTLGLKTTF